MEVTKRLHVAREAIIKAGDFLLENFLKEHITLDKPDHTTLLGEDLQSENILITAIKKEFPRDSILSEESDPPVTSDSVYIIDPLCGTFSYLRGVETWSLSIAFVTEGAYAFGIVYQPVLHNLFVGIPGQGATQNGRSIQVNSTSDLKRAFISVEHNVFLDGKFAITGLIRDIKRVRVGHGSGSELSYVAAGYLDAVIKTDQSPEHYAGGRVVLESAGGIFTDFNGNVIPVITDKKMKVDYIASNRGLAAIIKSYSQKNFK